MIPGTWFKWYVTDTAAPIYFRLIGQMRETDSNEPVCYVIDSQWHQRLYVNDWFLHWLLPLDEGEEGRFVDTKKFVPRAQPEKPKKNPLSLPPAVMKQLKTEVMRMAAR